MRNLILIILSLFIQTGLISSLKAESKSDSHGKASFKKKQVLKEMKTVANWQIANYSNDVYNDLEWTTATMFMGIKEFALLNKDRGKTMNWLLDVGNKNNWGLLSRKYHADDIAIGQVFLDLYQIFKNKAYLEPTQERANWVINNQSSSTLYLDYKDGKSVERWSWCDALFMAPPVYAKMYAITGDKKYVEFMDREFKMTYNLLFDTSENLFYRDSRFLDQREANGKKIFWGRGNGWVLGGLVSLLKDLPKSYDNRSFYEDLFVKMCQRVAQLQDDNGYWHASLLDPVSYPFPETSSSGFCVYALAYGINNNLLDRDKYLPVALKGWKALSDAVWPDGKLGWVQPVGHDPQKVTKEMTEVYGVGAFLLAGSEMYKIAK